MKVAIMQPYFLPYIGYFQLISAVDTFVIYDDIEYTKKGWINRNRILQNGKDVYISLPLKKDSDYLNVNQRFLSENWPKEKTKLLNRIKGNYSKAPYFNETYELLEDIFNFDNNSLFEFILNSLTKTLAHLQISAKVVTSSSLNADLSMKGEEKVIEICSSLKAKQYINAIGGLELYNKEMFLQENINLNFIKPKELIYQQFDQAFVPWLSIIDVLMFNEKLTIKEAINSGYELI